MPLDDYNTNDSHINIFNLLLVGFLAYFVAISSAYQMGIMIRHLCIAYEMNKVLTYFISEFVYYGIYITLLCLICRYLINEKKARIRVKNMILFLIVSYILIQFCEFAYVTWCHSLFSDVFISNEIQYYTVTNKHNLIQNYRVVNGVFGIVFGVLVIGYYARMKSLSFSNNI